MPGLFEKRHSAAELDRAVKFKRAMVEARDYVQRCQEAERRYWELGKRALRLGDRGQFERLAGAHLAARETANRWRRYLVAMESLSVHRDQAKATAAFARSMNSLSASVMEGAGPDDVARLQQDLRQAMDRARTLDETLTAVMDAAGVAILSTRGLAEKPADDGVGESPSSPLAAVDTAAAVLRVEEEMRREIDISA